MKKENDTVCPIFTFSDTAAMEILSCLSKACMVQTMFLAALSKNLLEEWKFLYRYSNLSLSNRGNITQTYPSNAIPDINNKS